MFTLNASGALKLVGESFPFGADRPFVLSADNHNSVNGIREFARRVGGADCDGARSPGPDLRLEPEEVERLLAHPPGGSPGLFAYPGSVELLGGAVTHWS